MVEDLHTETQEETDSRELRKKERQAALEREERIADLESIFSDYYQINSKSDRVLISLKEILSLAVSLNQKLSSGHYREAGIARRLRMNLMLQTFSAAINQLSRMNKLNKIVAPVARDAATQQIESSPAFE